MARRTSLAEWTVTPSTYRRITLSVLVTQVVIVLTGAAVRLTGSGLGCSDWPRCEQDRFVPSTEYHAVIEFVNRSVSLPVLVAVVAAVWAAGRRKPLRPELRTISIAILVGVAVQVLLGAVVVRLDLLPSTVIVHFLISMGLLFASVVLHHRAGIDLPNRAAPGEPAGPQGIAPGWAPQRTRHLPVALVVGATAVLVTGTIVTGSGPHGGDEDVERLDVFLPTAARIHSLTVWVFLAALVATLLLLRSERALPRLLRAGTVVLVASVVQGAIGYIQYGNGVPALLVFVHIIGAISVWVTAVWFWLEHRRLSSPGDRAPSPTPGRDGDRLGEPA